MSFPLNNVLFVSHKLMISAVFHINLSLKISTQHRTDMVQIVGKLETRATWSCTQQDPSCVELASWLLCIPFWLEAHYIFFRTSHFFSLSSSSELPTSFHYHHLFTSTSANHGSTNSSARCERIGIEPNDGHFIQYANCWHPTTAHTPLSPQRCCQCSYWKYDPGRTLEGGP